jgi:hypothetical protein
VTGFRPSGNDPIASFLGGVRARLQRRQALAGMYRWGTAVLGCGLLLLMVAAATGPANGWRPTLALAFAAMVIAFVVMLRRARLTWTTDDAVARWVGRRVPHIGDELLSAVELERELPKLEDNPILSAELVRAHRQRVAAQLGEVSPAQLIDFRAMHRAGLPPLAVVIATWMLLALVAPSWLLVGLRAWYASRNDVAQTAAEPIVGDVKLELDYPAYTALPPRVIPGSSGQVLALPGTVVRVEAHSLVPAREARLVIEDEQHKPVGDPSAAEVKDGVLRARFTVKQPGGWRFIIEGGGRRVREPEAHRIDLEPDRAPRVDLYAPAEALEVAGPRRVELAYSIDDDYGLGAIELVWRAGDRPEQRKVVRAATPPGQPAERAASGKFEWDLGELDLKPGVKVAYHLEARDNDTVPGPNVGVSRTYSLSMFSPREKHEAALADEERLLEQAVTLLGDRLELKVSGDGELVDAASRVHAELEQTLLTMAKVEQALEADKSTSEATRKELREMHTRLGKLSQEEEQLLAGLREKRRQPNGLKPGQARPLEVHNGKEIPELERDVIALDDLLGRQRLEELLRIGDEMAQARDRLKQLMQQYKKTRSEETRKEIERELRDLERKLAELRERASKLAAELPDQFLNADAMGKNDMQGDVDKIRQLLEQGKVDQAMAELEKMSSTLDQMMASMEGDLKSFRSERFSAEEKAMAELENKITDLQHDEQQLKSETEDVRQRTKAEAQKQMRDKVQPFVKKARDEVAQLKKHLEGVEQHALSPYDQEELQRIRQRVEDLDKMLQAGDLDEARGMARQADQGLEGVKADLREEEARAWHAPRPGQKKAREHVEEGEKIARQLADQIDKTLPKPGDLMNPADQKKMSELSERQRAARKRAQELQRELQKPGADGKPMAMPQQLNDGLRDAGHHMERAGNELQQRDARDAAGEESQALEQLQKLKEQMQQQRRPRDQMAGGRIDKEPVKIPGADEYKAPKEFRQDLLDAMKRQAPSEYRDQVKHYYEELVK